MVLGSPGGPRIITTIFQVLSNVLDHGMDIATAVVAPRIHHQHIPDQIEHEPGGLSADVVQRLRAIGHRVVEENETWGDAQAILVGEDGLLHAASDPRRGEPPVGF
jgi:gamma-glutamyltranspeptidase/glutathione hydrolase